MKEAKEPVDFYERTGSKIGWDFSRLQVHLEPHYNDLYQRILAKERIGGRLLDIGCGDGKKLHPMAEKFEPIVGIDLSKEMISKAKKAIPSQWKEKFQFTLADSQRLPFGAGSFNVVSARHAPVIAEEVFRVLRSEGHFYTQQVSELDKRELKEWFGRGQGFEAAPGDLRQGILAGLKRAGFTIIESRDLKAKEIFHRPEDLWFLLSHTPILPGFPHQKGDQEKFREFVEHFQVEGGIETQWARIFITAKKQ